MEGVNLMVNGERRISLGDMLQPVAYGKNAGEVFHPEGER